MARALSEEKRLLILLQAKTLFARHGFSATSVADVAKACDLPVGSIYTYFTNKEEIVRAIVEEGWEDLRVRLKQALGGAATPEAKMSLIINRFLPELLADSSFITILLSEAVEHTRLEEKAVELVALFEGILAPIAASRPELERFSRVNLAAALLVYFLGALDAVRLSSMSDLNVTADDVLEFLRLTVRNILGLSI
jgi:AcrR family transcriptional regulator